MKVAFFHQNKIFGEQGGIERYLSTLMTQEKGRCVLVSEQHDDNSDNCLGLFYPFKKIAPQWISFIVAVFLNFKRIRCFFDQQQVSVIELSRPEYALFSFLFKQNKAFTFHGSGPMPTEPAKWVIHYTACWLVPLCADKVQIIGKNLGALPRLIQRLLRSKIYHTQAWFDDCFKPLPYPDMTGPVRVFYAGRIAPAKNPELLYEIIRTLNQRNPNAYQFFYYGGDGHLLPPDIKNTSIIDGGLLSPKQLAEAINTCHFGLLTSLVEGSPFIVIESLACGRGFVLPPVESLIHEYGGQIGIIQAENYGADHFIEKMDILTNKIRKNTLSAETVSASVQGRSKAVSAKNVIDKMLAERQNTVEE